MIRQALPLGVGKARLTLVKRALCGFRLKGCLVYGFFGSWVGLYSMLGCRGFSFIALSRCFLLYSSYVLWGAFHF